MRTKLFTALAIGALGFSACSSDDDTLVSPNPKPEEVTVLKGSITSNLTVKAGTVTLDGPTIVQEGVTLTIPAGTKILAKDRSSYLLITKGAKINAKGTSTSPITFTSSETKSGSWGGLIINGKAPLSRANASDPSTFGTEINDQIQYGGNDVADNSGELDYVILEYTGSNISDDKEHNGLTLNGVGNGTKISNIYIKDGADDAIEFFGGSVNVTNLLVVNSEDDMFDFTQGYTGTLKNAYGIWTSTFTTNEADPRGVEADGNHDGNGSNHVAQSNFKMEDITIINNSQQKTLDKDGKEIGTMNDFIKVRRGATATITNLLLQNAANSSFSDIIDLTDGKGAGNSATSISYTFNPESLFSASKVKLEGASATKNTSSTGANTTVFGWTKYSF
jgi:hypothetical protein